LRRGYTIGVANPAGHAQTQLAPEPPADPSPLRSVPTFYVTSRQPLSPAAILLAIAGVAMALSAVLFALSHNGQGHKTSGTDRAASKAADQKDADDDPNQVDTIVIGDPTEAPVPARPGDHPSPVHPTILIHLPRWGDQMGMIPNSPAGQLLYNWLAAFNKANYSALAIALPNAALASATEAQMDLRRQTGGFSLLSAKEIAPGVLVFRLHDQKPLPVEVLGTLQVQEDSRPPAIASFSLRAVPAPAAASR
jgi:hypothetical protein